MHALTGGSRVRDPPPAADTATAIAAPAVEGAEKTIAVLSGRTVRWARALDSRVTIRYRAADPASSTGSTVGSYGLAGAFYA